VNLNGLARPSISIYGKLNHTNQTGPGKLSPEYRLYTKKGDRFLMAAKRRAHNATSNYVITLSDQEFAKESRDYLGKLRANFVGTEFQVRWKRDV
jgi:tubby and related proteins